MSLVRVSLLALALMVAVLATSVQSGSAASLRNCGGGVRAAIVACPKAKRIAIEYKKTHARSLQGYNCSSNRSRGRCSLDKKLVLFGLG
jgi:hypothetical protein